MYEDIPGRREALVRRSPPWRTLVGLALTSFVLGALLVWTLAGTPGVPARWLGHRGAVPTTPVQPQAPVPPAAPAGGGAEAHQAAQQVAQVAEQQGGIDQRVAALEQRLARLDLQA